MKLIHDITENGNETRVWISKMCLISCLCRCLNYCTLLQNISNHRLKCVYVWNTSSEILICFWNKVAHKVQTLQKENDTNLHTIANMSQIHSNMTRNIRNHRYFSIGSMCTFDTLINTTFGHFHMTLSDGSYEIQLYHTWGNWVYIWYSSFDFW